MACSATENSQSLNILDSASISISTIVAVNNKDDDCVDAQSDLCLCLHMASTGFLMEWLLLNDICLTGFTV